VLPYVVLGGAQIAVGAAAIFARYALAGAGPIAVSAARMAIAAIVLLLIAVVARDARAPATRSQNLVLAVAGLTLAAHFATWITSLEFSTVAISTLLVSTTPIWTALYDAFALGRKLASRTIAGFVGGAAGLLLVVGFDTTAPPIPGHAWLGAGLAVAGAIAIAAYLILVREVRADLSTRAIVTRTNTWAAVILAAAALVARQPLPPLHAAAAWGGIIAMAAISQLLGHTAINASLRWFSPSAVSFASLLEPVTAAVLALLIFGESVPRLAVVGAALLLASLALVLQAERVGDWPEPI
jgi:drug/metabolite transporter (DMT)-like permease